MIDRTRRAFAVALAGGLAGCLDGLGGDGRRDADNPALADAMGVGDLRVTSPAFEDGEPIPRRYGREGANANPPLEIDGAPADAAALALVVDDPDAVPTAGKVWVHWLVWNVPPDTGDVPEGWEAASAVEGENDSGSVGYDGPDPPDQEHTYRFKVYALDAALDLERGATVDEVGPAMDDALLASAQLTGTFAP